MQDAHATFSILILATQYMFNVTFAGMFAATIYFIMERNNLTPKYSVIASLCMMVVCIAAINYYHMAAGVGLDGQYATLSRFPTAFRYADWVLTTPIILSSLVMLTNSPNKGALAAKLMIADAVMIILGYIGEVVTNEAGGGTTTSWVCFMAACGGFVYILIVMYGELAEAAADFPPDLRSTFGLLQNFVLISWMVYPIGYLAPLLGYKGELLAVRELVYCIADLSAKVGFGILVVSLAKKLSLLEIEQKENI
jgi:sensory rhodopsin